MVHMTYRADIDIRFFFLDCIQDKFKVMELFFTVRSRTLTFDEDEQSLTNDFGNFEQSFLILSKNLIFAFSVQIFLTLFRMSSRLQLKSITDTILRNL